MAYGSRVLNIADEWDVQLILSYTCHGLKLQIIQSVHDKMAVWDVCKAQVWACDGSIYNFFFTLYLAVNRQKDISQDCSFFPLT